MTDPEPEEDAEPEECPHCDGYGELPGNPNTKHFPPCPMCNGTGLNPDQ